MKDLCQLFFASKKCFTFIVYISGMIFRELDSFRLIAIQIFWLFPFICRNGLDVRLLFYERDLKLDRICFGAEKKQGKVVHWRVATSEKQADIFNADSLSAIDNVFLDLHR